MINLIMIRHGQSQWNLENRFTGWVDVELTDKGRTEALQAGKDLKAAGITVDRCMVSPLKRAQNTATLVAKGLGQDLKQEVVPALIERFYGGLTGLNKNETKEKYGEAQVHEWRRSYDIPPLALELDDERHPQNPAHENFELFKTFDFPLPATESLKDVVDRVEPCLNTTIKNAMEPGKTLLLAAHGNSIRALVKLIKGLDNEAIKDVEISTGVPMIYQFDDGKNFVGEVK